jgi:hypothetical protein
VLRWDERGPFSLSTGKEVKAVCGGAEGGERELERVEASRKVAGEYAGGAGDGFVVQFGF